VVRPRARAAVAFVLVEACEEVCEFLAGEVPVDGLGDLVVVALEVVQRACELAACAG
jgi:hypothetical protein